MKAGCIRAKAEKGVLSQTDLPRVPCDQVPRLGNNDVAEGEEEKVDDGGLFGVDDERQGCKRQGD